jgi:hypothetical protein
MPQIERFEAFNFLGSAMETDFIGIGIKQDIYVGMFFSLTGEEKDVKLEKTLSLIAAQKH